MGSAGTWSESTGPADLGSAVAAACTGLACWDFAGRSVAAAPQLALAAFVLVACRRCRCEFV